MPCPRQFPESTVESVNLPLCPHMARPVVCIVRSRSLPASKRVSAPRAHTDVLTSLECERVALAMNALVAAPLTQSAIDGLADAIVHDFLRLKSAEFQRGQEHADWLHQLEKDTFLAQSTELHSLHGTIMILNSYVQVMASKYKSMFCRYRSISNINT